MHKLPPTIVRLAIPIAVAIGFNTLDPPRAAGQPSPAVESAPPSASTRATSAAGLSALDVWTFKALPYYEPLTAEPRAARIELTIPAWAKEFPHSEKPGSRFAWQVTLGRELPIVGIRSERLDGRVGSGQWGLGLWTPVSFHMIEDFKDESAPIVDTDYRFGAMVKFQYGLREDLWLGVKFVPWAHESTHLGDEYVILAANNPSFERINVSYENWEYGVSFEGSGLLSADDSWTFRHGGLKPWGNDGYYSDHLLGDAAQTLTPSQKNYEPSFGAEYVWPEWRGRHWYVSAEARHRLVYTYHQTANNPERRQWSWNLQVGRTVPPGTTGTPLKQYFVQVYHGVNPYGQLRSQRSWWSAGFGWIFGL